MRRRLRLDAHRSAGGRRRPRIVHRAAGRHRRDAGAGDGDRPQDRSGLGARRARRGRAADGSAPVAAWIDAQRGEVFAALYDAAGRRLLIEPSSLPPIRTLEAWEHALRASGAHSSATARLDTRPRSASGSAARAQVLPTPPLAGIIGRLAAAAPGARGAAARGRADLHSTAGRRAGPVRGEPSDGPGLIRPDHRADLGCRRSRRRRRARSRLPSPTRGRGRCSNASCASPMSRASTSSGCRRTGRGVLRLLARLRRTAHQHHRCRRQPQAARAGDGADDAPPRRRGRPGRAPHVSGGPPLEPAGTAPLRKPRLHRRRASGATTTRSPKKTRWCCRLQC